MSKVISICKGIVLVGLVILTGMISINAQTVSTLAGSYNQVGGMAFDKSGNMYLSLTSEDRMIKVTPAGVASTYPTTPLKLFKAPNDLAFDSKGNLYVSCTNSLNNTKDIRKIDPTGFSGPTMFASMPNLASIATDSSDNLLYLSQYQFFKNGISIAGKSLTNSIVNGVGAKAYLSSKTKGIVSDASGNFYITDAYDAKNGAMIRKITSNGTVSTVGPLHQIPYPLGGLAIDPSGNLFISASNKIYKMTPAGVVSVYAGTGTAGSTDGAANSATFSNPQTLVFSGGALYVVDYDNNKIRKIK